MKYDDDNFLLIEWQLTGTIVEDSPTAPQRSATFRPRGKQPPLLDWVCFNTSGKPQLEKALDYYLRSTCKQRRERRVAGMCVQEHHQLGDSWVNTKH